MATTVWGVKQLDEPQNIVYLECVKARDFTHCQPFQLRGRPCIDDEGDFALYRAPGDSGTLGEEQLNPFNQNRQHERNDRLEMVRTWLKTEPNLSGPEMVSRFAACGITVTDGAVRNYKSAVRKSS